MIPITWAVRRRDGQTSNSVPRLLPVTTPQSAIPSNNSMEIDETYVGRIFQALPFWQSISSSIYLRFLQGGVLPLFCG